VSYSIVRPTAFFKSVSGQLELLSQGWPFVGFSGQGSDSCRCNPIAETDLAAFLVNTIDRDRDPACFNKVLNIGGPDQGMTMKQQGEMIFKVSPYIYTSIFLYFYIYVLLYFCTYTSISCFGMID
jgi:divinyl chlorophyllide a 8-vinyl-reductase